MNVHGRGAPHTVPHYKIIFISEAFNEIGIYGIMMMYRITLIVFSPYIASELLE